MLKNINELGPREAEFISVFASKGKKFFTTKEAIEFWKNIKLTKKKLSVLQRKGWIDRIERGKYLVIPLEAGPQRQWSEHPFLIAGMLAEPACIAYWSAIHFWNWTEQMPRITYVQTTQRKNRKSKKIMGIQYEIVTVPRWKFYGHIKQWQGDASFLITDKEKTLIDCSDDPKRSGGIEELYKAVKNAAPEIDFNKLDSYVTRFKNGAVKKRLGYLFENVHSKLDKTASTVLKRWSTELSAGINPLSTEAPLKGKISTRWHLRINVDI